MPCLGASALPRVVPTGTCRPRTTPLARPGAPDDVAGAVAFLASAETDPNFRIATTRDAICVFNNRLFVSGTNIQAIFEQLPVEDPGHAFYLGTELMKARLALLLGKTYVQEQPLRWGYLTREREDTTAGSGSRGAGVHAAPSRSRAQRGVLREPKQ